MRGQDSVAALEGLLLVVLEGEQGQVGDALGGLEVDEEEVLVLAQPVVVADRQVLAGFLAREGVLGVEDGEAELLLGGVEADHGGQRVLLTTLDDLVRGVDADLERVDLVEAGLDPLVVEALGISTW